MFSGAHFLLYSTDADADRAFLRDVLDFKYVDVGHGWLIFAAPPSEMAVHPAEGDANDHQGKMIGVQLYLMCDDLKATTEALKAKKITTGKVEEERWGIRTTIKLPSGGEIGLYQPKHNTALGLK